VSTPLSEGRLRQIVEQAPDLIYYCDAEGCFTYLNPAARLILKYEPDELIGRPFLSILREDYRETASTLLARQFRQPIPNTYFEFAAVAKTGETIWIGQHMQLDVDGGAILGFHAIARDISRQKDTEERLRRSEQEYRSLVQGAAFGIYRSTEDGRILDANLALVQMLGYDNVEELLTRNMLDLYRSPEERAALLASGAHQHHGIGEVAWKKKDGTPILVRLAARIVEGSEAGVTCYETIAEDVTERRALEEQLHQAQKMEAVGRLARGIAHDFDNILAAIIGYSELIIARLKPESAVGIDAREIRSTAELGAALTRQLLAFSRSQALEPRVVDLHRAFDTDVNMLRQLMGPNVSLRADIVGPSPQVLIEPGQFEQVLLNLMVNARDAMPDGGIVTVTIDAIELGPRDVLRYPGTLSGSYARLTVRDTGTGIDVETQPHIFEPFFTTKTPEKGTGLGLAIVYGIVKDAGGTITFSTTPGKGTTFEVLFPLVR
jgi:two-component system, cell cycle sensor histidine kinase and response regulator CckA